jgi:hypothetical protein
MSTYISISIYGIYKYIYIYAAISNGKQKPRQFSLTSLLFAHHANGNVLFVCLFVKEQTEVIHLQTDYTD